MDEHDSEEFTEVFETDVAGASDEDQCKLIQAVQDRACVSEEVAELYDSLNPDNVDVGDGSPNIPEPQPRHDGIDAKARRVFWRCVVFRVG